MKRPGCASVFAGLAVFILLGCFWIAMPYAHQRYRMTIEIDTPDGVKSASSVHAVVWNYRYGAVTGFGGDLRGEAVLVDLNAGADGKPRLAIALMPGTEMITKTYGRESGAEETKEYAGMRGVRDVAPSYNSLTIVTFTDINNPATAKIVFGHRSQIEPDPARPGQQRTVNIPIDDMASTFGPGHAFRRATVEMMEPGIWPFNQFSSLTWPQWLFGEPLTTGIEGRLPVMLAQLRERNKTMQIERPGDPFRIGSGHLSVR